MDGMGKMKCVWTEPHVLQFHLHEANSISCGHVFCLLL